MRVAYDTAATRGGQMEYRGYSLVGERLREGDGD